MERAIETRESISELDNERTLEKAPERVLGRALDSKNWRASIRERALESVHWREY